MTAEYTTAHAEQTNGTHTHTNTEHSIASNNGAATQKKKQKAKRKTSCKLPALPACIYFVT